jgi:hypothetical protein
MSAAATIGTLLIFIFCALEVVGIATNYWMTVDHTSGLVKSHAGLFKICFEVLTIEQCFYFIQYAKEFLNGKNFNFCNCIVCIDCFVGYEKV